MIKNVTVEMVAASTHGHSRYILSGLPVEEFNNAMKLIANALGTLLSIVIYAGLSEQEQKDLQKATSDMPTNGDAGATYEFINELVGLIKRDARESEDKNSGARCHVYVYSDKPGGGYPAGWTLLNTGMEARSIELFLRDTQIMETDVSRVVILVDPTRDESYRPLAGKLSPFNEIEQEPYDKDGVKAWCQRRPYTQAELVERVIIGLIPITALG